MSEECRAPVVLEGEFVGVERPRVVLGDGDVVQVPMFSGVTVELGFVTLQRLVAVAVADRILPVEGRKRGRRWLGVRFTWVRRMFCR